MLSAVTTIMAAGSKSGGNGFSSILFILALAFGAMYLIVIRPQRRKQKIEQSMQSELAIGDEVLTAGGLYGKVTRIEDDEVRIEIAPNVEVRLARRAIAAQLTEGADADAAETAEPEYASDARSQSALDAESDSEKHG